MLRKLSKLFRFSPGPIALLPRDMELFEAGKTVPESVSLVLNQNTIDLGLGGGGAESKKQRSPCLTLCDLSTCDLCWTVLLKASIEYYPLTGVQQLPLHELVLDIWIMFCCDFLNYCFFFEQAVWGSIGWKIQINKVVLWAYKNKGGKSNHILKEDLLIICLSNFPQCSNFDFIPIHFPLSSDPCSATNLIASVSIGQPSLPCRFSVGGWGNSI